VRITRRRVATAARDQEPSAEKDDDEEEISAGIEEIGCASSDAVRSSEDWARKLSDCSAGLVTEEASDAVERGVSTISLIGLVAELLGAKGVDGNVIRGLRGIASRDAWSLTRALKAGADELAKVERG